jgi:RNA polymerase sigma-70 factor (ECF subfamily)
MDILRRQCISPLRTVPEDVALGVVDSTLCIPEETDRRQEIELLRSAIDTLPRRCREIFIMRKIRGLSQKAIARQLGLSVLTVQGQASRGMRRCKHVIATGVDRDRAA